MAVDAECAGTSNLVVVVLLVAKLREQMALAANRVHAHRGERPAVRVMAVRAGHALLVHLALQERAVLVVFFQDLAVSIINTFFQQDRLIRV